MLSYEENETPLRLVLTYDNYLKHTSLLSSGKVGVLFGDPIKNLWANIKEAACKTTKILGNWSRYVIQVDIAVQRCGALLKNKCPLVEY